MSKEQTAKPAIPANWKYLHLWQIQPVRDVLVLAALFGILHLGYVLRIVTVPILLALALAYMTEPLIRRIARPKVMSRSSAAMLFIFVAGAVIVVPTVLGTVFGAAQGFRVVSKLTQNTTALLQSIGRPNDAELRESLPGKSWKELRDYIVEKRKSRLAPETEGPEGPAPDGATPTGEPSEKPHPPKTSVPRMNDADQTLNVIIDWVRANSEAISKQAIITGTGAIQEIVKFLGSMSMFLFGASLTAFFYYFFSTGWGKVLDFWENLIPERRKGRVIDLVMQMDRVIAGFIRGRIIIAALQSLFYVIGFFAIGTPASLIVGVAAGVLAIVPYISIVMVPVAILLMWLEPGTGFRAEWWWIVGAPLGVYTIGQGIADYVLTPIIQGKSTEMDTATIVFVSIAGGLLAGVYGLLLAIPFAACVKILLREVFWPRFREWGKGRASDPLPISQS